MWVTWDTFGVTWDTVSTAWLAIACWQFKLKYPQNGGNFRQILIDYSNGINNN